MNAARANGFGLIELLVATAILLVLAGSLLTIAMPSHQGFRVQPAAIEVQQRLRVGVDTLTYSLLHAGAGPVSPPLGLPLGATVPCLLPYRVGLRRADLPGQYHEEVLTVMSSAASAAAPRIAASFQGPAGTIPVSLVPGCPVGDAACGLQPGMSVLLADASGQWDLYGVSAVVADRITLEARGVSSRRRYLAGAWLVPVEIAVHYLRPPGGPDGGQLMRYDGYQSDLPQVDHVAALSFAYYGDPRPPQLRAEPGPVGQVMTYGPAPPGVAEDDDRDSWGAGENCVTAVDAGRQVPRLGQLNSGELLAPLDRAALTDGPWCPDAASPARFDADLLRVRKVRVTLRVEAPDAMRGADPRLFRRPGIATGTGGLVPDLEVTFEVVPRTLGGGR